MRQVSGHFMQVWFEGYEDGGQLSTHYELVERNLAVGQERQLFWEGPTHYRHATEQGSHFRDDGFG